MSIKWQYFVGGLLTGILLSGTIYLIVIRITLPSNFAILRTENEIELTAPSPQSVSSNKGKININTAMLEELINLPGVGDSKANAIIDFREKYGPFETIDELLYVPGFGEALVLSIKEYIIVE